MKAIQVKYLGPTNHKPSRFKAFTDHQSITRSYDSSHSFERFSELLALELCAKMRWMVYGDLVYGTLKNGDYVFCFPESTVS